ncbi:condensation domain-containing protein [Catellatospora sp. NPDC049609]|uniref:condensation domain-containing protein n=1 Tax=Catellatospora sp. NPDC049609 TaxID=3155505 RepID=UPI00341A1800
MTDVTMESPVSARPSHLVELPLTPLQARWWQLCSRFPGGMSPLVDLVHRLRGPLDADAWARSVDAVVDRHEILRTLFADRPGGPVQLVGPARGIGMELIDLRDLPAEQREERARELLNERRRLALDLRTGPLVHTSLLRLADDDHVWRMTIHHILADGASLGVIDRELGALYPALAAGTAPVLPELTVQYGDFALWQSTADTEQEDEDREYWRAQLAGLPPLDLVEALPRPAEKGAPAAEVARAVDGELTRRIEELARAARCTRFMVLLAALHVLLSRASGQVDFAVGIPVAGVGRTRPELARLVGLFNNALALRCDLSGDPSFREILAATRETVIDALDHQDLPWGEVVAALGLPHDPGRAQGFQAMFLHDEVRVASRLVLPGLRVEEFALGIPRVLHDLMVYAGPGEQGLSVKFVYDTGLFTAETVSGLAEGYERLLRTVADDPDVRLSELVK